jgi:hypothetical protein
MSCLPRLQRIVPSWLYLLGTLLGLVVDAGSSKCIYEVMMILDYHYILHTARVSKSRYGQKPQALANVS